MPREFDKKNPIGFLFSCAKSSLEVRRNPLQDPSHAPIEQITRFLTPLARGASNSKVAFRLCGIEWPRTRPLWINDPDEPAGASCSVGEAGIGPENDTAPSSCRIGPNANARGAVSLFNPASVPRQGVSLRDGEQTDQGH